MSAIDAELAELNRRLVFADRDREIADIKRMIASLENLKIRTRRVAQVFAASEEIAF